MKIIEVSKEDTKGIDHFFRLPIEIYRQDRIYTPEAREIIMANLFSHSRTGIIRQPFLAMEGDKPVARAVSILHPKAQDEQGRRQGWIGLFEAVEGYDSSVKKLLDRAEKELRQKGALSVLATKSDNMTTGLLAAGFDLPQTILTGHNPPYYIRLFTECGYRIKRKTVTYYFTRRTLRPLSVCVPGLVTRTLDRNKLSDEIIRFNQIQNSVFAGGNGYLPRSLEEDEEMIESFLPFMDDELIIFAEDKNGNSLGVLVCLPDYYQGMKGQRITRARIISIAAVPKWQRKGAGKAMAFHLMKNLLQKGYEEAEASWILAENMPPQNLALRFSARPGRKFVLMEKQLETGGR